MLEDGKLLAWIEIEGDHKNFVAAFVGEGAAHGLDEINLGRAPATQLCSSREEARQWISDQAEAVGLPVKWLNTAPDHRNTLL